MSNQLPELLDARRLAAELGVTRAAAEAVMRRLPSVQIEDLRKTYCRRADVAAYLEARTFSKDQVADRATAKCVSCSGWVSTSCVICRGAPDESVDVRRIAIGVGQVDRATRGRAA